MRSVILSVLAVVLTLAVTCKADDDSYYYSSPGVNYGASYMGSAYASPSIKAYTVSSPQYVATAQRRTVVQRPYAVPYPVPSPLAYGGLGGGVGGFGGGQDGGLFGGSTIGLMLFLFLFLLFRNQTTTG